MVATTSTIFLPPLGIGPPTADIESSNGRVVRFESECVLIPEITTKLSRSYSLPLWKKKLNQSSDSVTELSLPASPSTDTHVVLKVPIPRFISKTSRSPTRGRASNSPPMLKPLASCLVHRSPSLSPTLPHKSVRRTSLPISTEKRKDGTAVTVPLRDCCPDCQPITEESFMEGEQWTEKFSRGARRRRSYSLDSPGASTRYNESSGLSLTVDEVDKRRKSTDYTDENLTLFNQRQISPTRVTASTSRSPSKEFSSISSPSELSTGDYPSCVKSSPIQEEDEDQLFPLPSPRRSPASSKAPSPATSPKPSPSPSPNVSSTCLSPSSYASVSKDSLTHGFRISQDGLLGDSISRKVPQSDNGCTQAPAFSLTLSIPNDSTLTSDWEPHESSPMTTNTHRKPRPQPQTLNMASSSVRTLKSRKQPLPTRGRGTDMSKPLPPFPSPSPHPPVGLSTSTSHPTSPTTISSRSPSRSPVSPKRVFTLPFLDALRGAGADVLKGVNSIGAGGGAIGSI